MPRLASKIAVISGGAGGLGASCAEAMIREGATVVVADSDEQSGRALCSHLGPSARFVTHDALSADSWSSLYESLGGPDASFDILVNCVGAVLGDPIDQASLDGWRRTLSVNLDSVFLGCSHGIPVMRRGRGGSIINFGSTMGLRARGDSIAYSTAKAGLLMMTRSIAIRCAEAGWAIRCNSVSPGTVLTELTETMLRSLVAAGRAPSREAAIDMIASTRPLRRLGEATEVAEAVIFLASEEASYVTGIDLPVDGGYSAA